MSALPTLAAYYATHPAGRERDYGWWLHRTWRRYRLTWAEATGDLYLFDAATDTVEVLANIPDAEVADVLLAGWADQLDSTAGLEWVRRRLALVGL